MPDVVLLQLFVADRAMRFLLNQASTYSTEGVSEREKICSAGGELSVEYCSGTAEVVMDMCVNH